MASPTGDNDAGSSGQEISFELQSRDLPSIRQLGKGLSGIGYETIWKGARYARKDFVGVQRDIFLKEAAILVGLQDHKNIVKTYGWTVDKRSCSLVLEYMEEDLLSLLQKRMESRTESKQGLAGEGIGKQSSTSTFTQPFDLPEAVHMMLQISTAMEYLHDQGIAHGDLKTKNILVTQMNDGDQNLNVVKVADFGLARTKRKSKFIVPRKVRKLDMARWKAPEYLKILVIRQLNLSNNEEETSSESESESTPNSSTSPVDVFAADVYSFAVTCSHILTGNGPYPDLGWKELAVGILSGLRPKLPDACHPLLRDLLISCWSDRAPRLSFSIIRLRLKRLHELLKTDSSADIERPIGIVPSPEPLLPKRSVPGFGEPQNFLIESDRILLNKGSEIAVNPMSKLVPAFRENSRVARKNLVKRTVWPEAKNSSVTLYRGVRYRQELNKYVAEIRPTRSSKKIWLGTYDTAEEAARAFDIGNLCCKKNLPLNFADSPRMLRKISSRLSPDEARNAIAKLAKEVARIGCVSVTDSMVYMKEPYRAAIEEEDEASKSHRSEIDSKDSYELEASDLFTSDILTPALLFENYSYLEGETILDSFMDLVFDQRTQNLKDLYTLGRKLGEGQFGTTYLCLAKATGKEYACKSIAKLKLVSQEDVDNVRRELCIMLHLSGHPNIVTIKGAYEDEVAVHLVMEYCAGGELFDRIIQRGHYSEAQAAQLCRVIVQVVETCHSLGVMHRDLKPQNFLFTDTTENATLKIADFGLSVFFQPSQTLTDVVGSPYNVAPEVLRKRYGPKADVWSAGVILYTLLSGDTPFWAETEQEIFEQVLKGEVDLVSEPWPSVSDSAKDLIRKMLDLNVKSRLSADQVLCHPWIREGGVAPDRPMDPVVQCRLKADLHWPYHKLGVY